MPVTRAMRRQPRAQRRDEDEMDEEEEEEEDDELDANKLKKGDRRGPPSASSNGSGSKKNNMASSTSSSNNKKTKSSSRSLLSLVGGALLLGTLLLSSAFWWFVLPHAQKIDYRKTKMSMDRLHRHCQEQVGEPRVEEVTEGVFMAMGYDLANTILIKTTEGHVVVSWGERRERGGWAIMRKGGSDGWEGCWESKKWGLREIMEHDHAH